MNDSPFWNKCLIYFINSRLPKTTNTRQNSHCRSIFFWWYPVIVCAQWRVIGLFFNFLCFSVCLSLSLPPSCVSTLLSLLWSNGNTLGWPHFEISDKHWVQQSVMVTVFGLCQTAGMPLTLDRQTDWLSRDCCLWLYARSSLEAILNSCLSSRLWINLDSWCMKLV